MKKPLREKFLKIRNEISDKAACAESAANIFLQNIPLKTDDIIGAYYPIKGELNTIPLLHKLSDSGFKIALPVVTDKNGILVFREWKIFEQLNEDGMFKIPEPPESSAILKPDILIVPLLAFDNDGYRLGYGGGFYDRTISSLEHLTTVGYAYSCQYIAKLPNEAHDVRLDYVVTEEGVKIISQPSS